MITAMLVKGIPEWLADNESIAMVQLPIDSYELESDTYTVCYTDIDGDGVDLITLTCDVVYSEEEQVNVLSEVYVTENCGVKFEKVQQNFISGSEVDISNVLIALTLLDTYDDQSKPFFSATFEKITDIIEHTGVSRNYTTLGRWVEHIIPNKVQKIYFDRYYTATYIRRFFKTNRIDMLLDSPLDHSEYMQLYIQNMVLFRVSHDILSEITLPQMVSLVPPNMVDWVLDNVKDLDSFMERMLDEILQSNSDYKSEKANILGKLYHRNKKPFQEKVPLVVENILELGNEYQWVYDLVENTPYDNIMEWFVVCRSMDYPYKTVMKVVPELYKQEFAIPILSFDISDPCEYIIEKVFTIELNRKQVNPEIVTILFSLLCEHYPELAKQISIFNYNKLIKISPEIKCLCVYLTEREESYYE